MPTPIDPPRGCPFATRCRYAAELCSDKRPALEDVGEGHYVACHIYGSEKKEMAKQMEAKKILPPKRESLLKEV